MGLFSFDKFLVLDGSTGYNLQKAGMPAGVCPEAWVLERPSALMDLQRRYMAAGSDAVYAATFGANRVKLKKYGLGDRVEDINERLVNVSRNAVCSNALVAGDISPLGLFVKPFGDVTFEEMYEIYLEQAASLEKAGVDFFVIETMLTLAEARAALLAVKAVSDKPVAVSFTFEKNGRTINGTDPCTALTVMQSLGADAFGINCSNGPCEVLVLIRQLTPYTRIPLLSKPNAGIPQVDTNGNARYDMSPAAFCGYTDDFVKAGVRLFGGCCGTTPEHIAALTSSVVQCDPNGFKITSSPILAATERKSFVPDTDDCIECDADEMVDSGYEVGEDGVVWVRINTPEDAETVLNDQSMLPCALGIRADSEELAERVIRGYNGRLLCRRDDLGDKLAGCYGIIAI